MLKAERDYGTTDYGPLGKQKLGKQKADTNLHEACRCAERFGKQKAEKRTGKARGIRWPQSQGEAGGSPGRRRKAGPGGGMLRVES
jgi:hypothetical protein